MNVLVAGYPYVRESYVKTFSSYPKSDGMIFFVPRAWPIKDGKAVYHPPKGDNIYTGQTYFYHSNYPAIGGLLKGLMPLFPLFLLKNKRRLTIGVVFSPLEPILLTTLYQAFWSKIFGLKHVFFSWENIPYGKKFKGINGIVKRIILGVTLWLSDGVICGNSKAEKIFNDITNKKLAVIPLSGLDTGLFKPVDKGSFFKGIDLRGKKVLTFVGSISYRKGVHVALKALAGLVTEFPNIIFVIAGSGEYELEIDALIKQLKLGQYIIRLPWINHQELKELLSATDVFLYPSISYNGWEEQFGYSMAEASLMEVPVIATNSGSIEDVVVNGKTGLLVRPDSVDELKGAILRLLHDPALGKSLGVGGGLYVAEHYSNEVIARRFYEFFKSL